MSILSTIYLCKTYGEGETGVEALKETNLRIEKGEYVAVIGRSGQGFDN